MCMQYPTHPCNLQGGPRCHSPAVRVVQSPWSLGFDQHACVENAADEPQSLFISCPPLFTYCLRGTVRVAVHQGHLKVLQMQVIQAGAATQTSTNRQLLLH